MPPPDVRGGRDYRSRCRAHWTLNVPKRRKHAGVEVVEQMAMKRPGSRGVVGIKGDDDAPPGWDEHSIAHCPREALAVDLDDLELVAVQIDRKSTRLNSSHTVIS